MKHIKPYKIFESQEPQHPDFPTTEEEIHELCKKYEIENYTINDNLSIDVDGDVYLYGLDLIYLLLNFNYVSGNFFCSDNKLKTLEGAPHTVGGNFDCDNNRLTSLKGSPKTVGGDFDCINNELESLKYCPEEIGGAFDCSDNKLKTLKGISHTVGGSFDCGENELTSLEGAPHTVGGYFSCSDNKLKTLKGAPHTIGGFFDCDDNNLTSLKGSPHTIDGDFDCYENKIMSLKYLPNGIDYTAKFTRFDRNPIHSVVNTFIRKDNAEDLIQEFNDYDIVRSDEVVLSRLETFINDFDLEMPNLDRVKEYYEIV